MFAEKNVVFLLSCVMHQVKKYDQERVNDISTFIEKHAASLKSTVVYLPSISSNQTSNDSLHIQPPPSYNQV